MENILPINDLPPEKLPDFWNDTARINALYAPFRERSVNPRDWDSKLNFWRLLINTWCTYNKLNVFSEIELKKWLIRNDRVPACLSIVLGEMHKCRELQTLSEFLQFPQKTWSGWALDVTIKKPLLWSFNKIKNTFVAPITVDTKFVHLPSVETLSNLLITSIPNCKRNKLISIEQLIENTEFKNVNHDTVKLLLHHLYCANKIDLLQLTSLHKGGHEEPLLIKVGFVNEKVKPITEIDTGIYGLEQNEKILLHKLEMLELEKAEATKNAKLYVSKGMRQMAKTCLRKQHELEKRIDKQVAVLENVQTLLGRIGTAESDSKVLESYRSGLAALKTVFKDNGLSEDSAADTMLGLSEALESHDDIQSTLSQSVSAVDEAELEEELAELLQDSSQPSQPTSPQGGIPGNKAVEDDLEQRLKNLKLPSVPSETPDTSPVKTYPTYS